MHNFLVLCFENWGSGKKWFPFKKTHILFDDDNFDEVRNEPLNLLQELG